jgi:hypothetical protein
MNKIKIIIIIVFLAIGIQCIILYQNNVKDLQENYITVDTKIKFVGKTGKSYYVKSLLSVEYMYNGKNYSGNVLRRYSKDYKKGNLVKIYVNKDDGEIQ